MHVRAACIVESKPSCARSCELSLETKPTMGKKMLMHENSLGECSRRHRDASTMKFDRR